MAFEQLEPLLSTDPNVFIAGEKTLAGLGKEALPVLESFFSGKACNRWGVAYRAFSGHAMRCVFATIFLLGPVAKPLEPWIRAELKNRDPMCADALAALEVLEPESIEALAFCVRQPDDMAWQAASALIKCGYGAHPAFQDAVASLAENKTHGARMLERYIESSIRG